LQPPSEPSYLAALNPQQREAVLHSGEPLLILAGAGSGKTRVITTKIAYLVDRGGVPPEAILAVAFTNKAADEMRERVRALCPAGAAVMIRTFHSFGAWLLRRYGAAVGIPAGFTIYDDEDSHSVLKALLGGRRGGGGRGRRDESEPGPERMPAARIKEIAGWIARAKDRCLLPDDDLGPFAQRAGALQCDFPSIYRRYQDHLQRAGCLDFGDLIVRGVRLLEANPELARKIRDRFRVILVDEYQDSNLAQLALLEQLYEPASYLCVVGDEDQSIYSFRGAELSNILNFAEHFPGTRVVRLEENYRSTQNILAVATRVVEHNTERLGKTLWTRKSAGSPVVLAAVEDPEQEAQFCAHVLQDGRLGQTAILYRMNFQSRAFESLFSRLGIPFRVVGTARFYEREEIKDALAYLVLLVNPRDELALRRALSKPRRGLGAKTIEAILAQRGGDDLLQCARLAAGRVGRKAAAALSGFLAVMEELRLRLESEPPESLSEVVHRLIMQTGLVDHYRERDRGEGTGRLDNLEELVNATSEYSGDAEGLGSFLETLMLNSGEEDPFRHSEQVTLITVHNTKGLEFDRVFVTGLEDGIFPHYASTLGGVPVAGPELEEERRLFYVAVTRAREELYLSSCRQRRVFGRLQSAEPSRFLREIPPEHLSVYGQAAVSAEQHGEALSPGCGVYHDEYGGGVVTRAWRVEGVSMVAVRFDSGRIARFPVKYSRLERVSTDT